MRLIDADAMMEFITQLAETPAEEAIASVCRGAALSMPTIDAVPVVYGRWDNVPNTYMAAVSKDGSYSGNATTCSVCHEVNPNAYKTNFCPNCGAKMDLGQEER